MAELMPWASGILMAWAIWGCAADRGIQRRSPTSAEALRGRARRAVLAAAYELGARLPAAMRAQPWVVRCGQELVSAAKPLLGDRVVDHTTAAGALALTLLASAGVGAVVALSPLGALVGAGIPAAAMMARAGRAQRAREQLIEAAMPEAFHGLSISLGSGHSLAQALRFVGNHAPEPVGDEFMRAACALSCGVSAADALDVLLTRLPAPGLDLVALALKVSQRTGAPLQELLEQAARMVGERIELTRSLEVKTAQARLSARLVSSMPVAMIAVLTLLSPDFRSGLATPVGAGSVGAALVLNVCALFLIRRIMGVRVA